MSPADAFAITVALGGPLGLALWAFYAEWTERD